MNNNPIYWKDNSLYSLSEAESPALRKQLEDYAGVSLTQLQENHKGFLVIPDKFGFYGDSWNQDEPLFSFFGDKIKTGNIVGFFGIDDVDIRIISRFDDDEKQYFLQYMLNRVLGMNMVNLKTAQNKEPIWDFLKYCFPFFLKRALRQGIYRRYRFFAKNDDRVHGAIDIARHLRDNYPFTGKIAYNTHEYSGNNFLIQLIRHTIEIIRQDNNACQVLTADEEIRNAVRVIMELTPDFNRSDIFKIVAQNCRPVRHPFFTEYTVLQKLCLKILRQEKISYGTAEDKLNGIIFKAEWLWEEYIAAILKECDITHIKKGCAFKENSPKITIYTDNKTKQVYPDFKSDKLILDTKYKKIIKEGNAQDKDQFSGIQREDRFQLISYIHICNAHYGILIYPNQKETRIYYEDGDEGKINGGGVLSCISFKIPTGSENFDKFKDNIKESEELLKKCVIEIRNKANIMDSIT